MHLLAAIWVYVSISSLSHPARGVSSLCELLPRHIRTTFGLALSIAAVDDNNVATLIDLTPQPLLGEEKEMGPTVRPTPTRVHKRPDDNCLAYDRPCAVKSISSAAIENPLVSSVPPQ